MIGDAIRTLVEDARACGHEELEEVGFKVDRMFAGPSGSKTSHASKASLSGEDSLARSFPFVGNNFLGRELSFLGEVFALDGDRASLKNDDVGPSEVVLLKNRLEEWANE